MFHRIDTKKFQPIQYGMEPQNSIFNARLLFSLVRMVRWAKRYTSHWSFCERMQIVFDTGKLMIHYVHLEKWSWIFKKCKVIAKNYCRWRSQFAFVLDMKFQWDGNSVNATYNESDNKIYNFRDLLMTTKTQKTHVHSSFAIWLINKRMTWAPSKNDQMLKTILRFHFAFCMHDWKFNVLLSSLVFEKFFLLWLKHIRHTSTLVFQRQFLFWLKKEVFQWNKNSVNHINKIMTFVNSFSGRTKIFRKCLIHCKKGIMDTTVN